MTSSGSSRSRAAGVPIASFRNAEERPSSHGLHRSVPGVESAAESGQSGRAPGRRPTGSGRGRGTPSPRSRMASRIVGLLEEPAERDESAQHGGVTMDAFEPARRGSGPPASGSRRRPPSGPAASTRPFARESGDNFRHFRRPAECGSWLRSPNRRSLPTDLLRSASGYRPSSNATCRRPGSHIGAGSAARGSKAEPARAHVSGARPKVRQNASRPFSNSARPRSTARGGRSFLVIRHRERPANPPPGPAGIARSVPASRAAVVQDRRPSTGR